MAYADLTQEQQQKLQTWLAVLRSWCGEQARTNNHGQAVDTGYNADVSAILGELLDADEVPNTSGLDGATALTKAEIVSVVSHVQGIATSYNTAAHRQLWSKGCGERNLIG